MGTPARTTGNLVARREGLRSIIDETDGYINRAVMGAI
jgi:hypothetical protein